MDWDYLTVRQAAADHHRIVGLLKKIYVGKWVSAGASKGGETVLFHRRFFPEDVDATVAYVAPLLFSAEDPRFLPYLRSRGTPLDRAAVFGFQRLLLERKDELLPVFQDWFSQRGLVMSLPWGATFEDEVASYEWGFWQRHIFDREDIPGPNATTGEMVDHLAIVVRLTFTSDQYRDYFQAYVYQGLTEIGLPYFRADHLEDLFAEEEVDVRTAYSFPPDLEFHYRPETIPDIVQWVRTWGEEIILIYGEDDPWTAGALELTGQTDALKVVQVGADHGVRITELDQRNLVLGKLGEWLEMDLSGIAFREILVPQRLTRPLEADLRLLGLF
jgi:hypothetical protein